MNNELRLYILEQGDQYGFQDYGPEDIPDFNDMDLSGMDRGGTDWTMKSGRGRTYHGRATYWDPYEFDLLKSKAVEFERELKNRKVELAAEETRLKSVLQEIDSLGPENNSQALNNEADKLTEKIRFMKNELYQAYADYSMIGSELQSLSAAKQKRKTWGSRPEDFGQLGPRASRILSKTADVTDAINRMVAIGDTIQRSASSIAKWKANFHDFLVERRRAKTVNSLSMLAVALASAVLDDNKSLQKKIEAQIRNNSDIQGQSPLWKLIVIEICLAFLEVQISHRVEEVVRNVLPRHYNHKFIRQIIERKQDRGFLESESQSELDKYARNLDKYKKEIKMRRTRIKKYKPKSKIGKKIWSVIKSFRR